MSSPSATLAAPDARPAATETGPWREPGQAVDATYLRDGKLRYHAEGHEIVGRNRAHFNNRPLYCRLNTDGAVLTGDRPLARLIAKPYLPFGDVEAFTDQVLRAVCCGHIVAGIVGGSASPQQTLDWVFGRNAEGDNDGGS